MNRHFLSADLVALLEKECAVLSLNEILRQTQGRGLYLLLMLLSLPFVIPVPLPGVSTVIGVVILWLGVRLAVGLSPLLPKKLGDKPLPFSKQKKVLSGSVKLVQFLERFVRPRAGIWMRSRVMRCVHGGIIALMGLLLILPFPPFVFFTNSLPAWGVILICASMAEEDGVLVWAGYLVSLLAFLYICFLLLGGTKIAIDLTRRWF